MLAAAWLTATTTLVLAIFAGLAALFAGLALRKQSRQLTDERGVNKKQVEVLTLQSAELKELAADRAREAAERRSAQARQVLMWEERHEQDPRVTQAQRNSGVDAPYTVQVFLENGSSQPIYDVTFRWHTGTQPTGQSPTVGVMPPHAKQDMYSRLPDGFPASGNKTLVGAIAYFRDANGTCWRAYPDREPEEVTPDQMPTRQAD